ncbi:MAG: 16S rRNA (adenine(1518)-N(6)/adenine(1519)-N(6))-dimethyltransferase RsmA [Chloroflexaceae bacterium]
MNPYLSPQRVRAALHSLGLRPTRGMGQNFLIDQHVLQTIVASAELTAADRVIEVGPGLGVLTWELLQQAGQVLAVELDKRLAARLREEFAAAQQLQVIQADILKLPPADIFEQAGLSAESPYKVVANLPYAITSPVLRHFLEAAHKPGLLVILIQWEVARRITATAGNLSVLAHSVQIYAQPEIVARVPAGSFFPQPAVDSAILRLQVYPTPAVAVDSIDALFRVIKAGFLQPRKKLSNALPGGLAAMGQQIPRETAVAALEAAGVAPERRAETVTLEEWSRVYTALRDM